MIPQTSATHECIRGGYDDSLYKWTFALLYFTCYEEMKGMPNAKILVVSHPLGHLRVTHRVHLYDSMESALSNSYK